MFISKVLIAALALAGSQAVSIQDPLRGFREFCNERGLEYERCETRQDKVCSKNPSQNKRDKWFCDFWDTRQTGSSLAQTFSQREDEGEGEEVYYSNEEDFEEDFAEFCDSKGFEMDECISKQRRVCKNSTDEDRRLKWFCD